MTPQPDTARPARPRILCVDDEAQILEAIAVNLGRQFSVTTALSGAAGLEKIRSEPPFAVLMSDMRMPGMNGAVFLKAACEAAPDTVRILLTGQADLDSAIAAVNEGQIFRFLSKPCPPASLIKTIALAVEQNRLITSEKILLEQTLAGSIRTLTDILALTNPDAFGKGLRLKRTVTRLGIRLGLTERWPLEVAAMVCQIGCVILPPKVAEALNQNKPLTVEERQMVERVPATTKQLLSHIPRLEPVLELLSHQGPRLVSTDKPTAVAPAPAAASKAPPPLAARILALALDLDVLEASGVEAPVIRKRLRASADWYDPKLLDALEAEYDAVGATEVTRELRIQDLAPGMTFVDDVKTSGGTLLIARGHEVTPGVLEKIRNFHSSGGVKEPVRVNVTIRSGQLK